MEGVILHAMQTAETKTDRQQPSVMEIYSREGDRQ